MADSENISRRAFLKRFAAGALAGGAMAAATAPEEKPDVPDLRDANPHTAQAKKEQPVMLQRVLGGALVGGFLTEAAYRAATEKPVKPRPGRADAIRKEFEKGRDWEWKQQCMDRNVGDADNER